MSELIPRNPDRPIDAPLTEATLRVINEQGDRLTEFNGTIRRTELSQRKQFGMWSEVCMACYKISDTIVLKVESFRYRTGTKSFGLEKVERLLNEIEEPFVVHTTYRPIEGGVERNSFSETQEEAFDREDMPRPQMQAKAIEEFEAREHEEELGLVEFKEKEGVELVQLLAQIHPDEDEISFEEFFDFQDVRHDLS